MKAILTILLLLVPAVSWTSDMLVVPAVITYQGRSVKVIMSVDTGASRTTIGTRLAERLGIPREARASGLAEMADGRTVQYRMAIMDVTVENAAMSRKDMAVNIMEYAGKAPVDGLLGIDFLSRMSMLVDWKRHLITWIRE